MKWNDIAKISNRLAKIISLSISILPFLGDVLSKIEDKNFFMQAIKMNITVLAGALIYMVACFIAEIFMPEVISKYKKREDYQKWCRENHNNIDYQIEFPLIFNKSESELKNNFPKHLSYLPNSKARLIHSSQTVAFHYAFMEYEIQNRRKKALRFFLTISFFVSICMIIFPQILRIYTILGGL